MKPNFNPRNDRFTQLLCYEVTERIDFEIWDERYKPESSDNEIDLYVALK